MLSSRPRGFRVSMATGRSNPSAAYVSTAKVTLSSQSGYSEYGSPSCGKPNLRRWNTCSIKVLRFCVHSAVQTLTFYDNSRSSGFTRRLKPGMNGDAQFSLPSMAYRSVKVTGSYRFSQDLMHLSLSIIVVRHTRCPSSSTTRTSNLHFLRFTMKPAEVSASSTSNV